MTGFDAALDLAEIGTPTWNPAAGRNQLYFKSDGLLYRRDETGQENPIDTGGGGGSSALTVTQREYTANATWTKPGNLVALLVEVVGAGGGGGGANTTAGSKGGGGGGGGYVRCILSAADLLGVSTVAVTIGVGGGGGGAGNTGGAGSASSFGSYATGGGGGGGASLTGVGAAGGGTSGVASSSIASALLVNGGNGGGGTGITSPLLILSGAGGATTLGMGGVGRTLQSGSSQVGVPGSNYGAGGGGAANATTTSSAGGGGADGVVLVTEFVNTGGGGGGAGSALRMEQGTINYPSTAAGAIGTTQTITFAVPFTTVPAINIIGIGGGLWWSWDIGQPTTTGFTMRARNGGSGATAQTFLWSATGT